ncbi:MAG: dTDP-4-dehydrorhamnose reductase, partial [Candidatus Paceibacteria bacterium]
MRFFILGSRGMLGQELVRVFSGNEVIAWDRADLDITNQTQIFKKIKELKIDIILNAAAYNAVDKAEEQKDLAFAVNAEAVKYLALAAKNIGAIIVHYSTDYVFEGTKKQGYNEDDAVNPQSVYAKSKAKGEEYLREVGVKYYLIRLSRLFGKPGIGDESKKSFVDLILHWAAEKKELEVVNEELSSPTYAPDLAKLTKELINQSYPYGIYHGANSGACTWYEFAQEVLKLKNIPCKLIPVSASRFPRPA